MSEKLLNSSVLTKIDNQHELQHSVLGWGSQLRQLGPWNLSRRWLCWPQPFEEDMMEANHPYISWADLYWDDDCYWDDTCCDVLNTTIDCGPGYHGYYLHHQWDIWDCQMTAHVDTGYCSESDSSKSEPNEPKWNPNIDADEDPNFKDPYFVYGHWTKIKSIWSLNLCYSKNVLLRMNCENYVLWQSEHWNYPRLIYLLLK